MTPFYPPHIGGIERHSLEFARAAIGLGLAVNVVSTDAIREPELSLDDDGINVLRIPARYLHISGGQFPLPLRGRARIAEFLRCDAIVAQTRFFPTTLMAARIAAGQQRRICVIDHGSGPLRSSRLLRVASMGYEHVVTSALRRYSPRFFAVSAASAQWLEHFGIREATVIPNGITPRERMPIRRNDTFAKPIVFFAGRLLPEKGVQELVEGVESLAKRGVQIELRIAGQGPLSPMVRRWAADLDSLVYLGSLSPGDIARELDHASVLVNPSRLPEGLPTILLEAGSAALPVISTLSGGSAEIIRDGETGWVLPRGSPACIAATLEAVIAQPDEAIRRGRNLFRLVQESYTWPTIVAKFLRCIS